MTQNPFEIPQQMRDLAQKNIEQASAAYGQLMGAMTHAMDGWSKAIPAICVDSVGEEKLLRFRKEFGAAVRDNLEPGCGRWSQTRSQDNAAPLNAARGCFPQVPWIHLQTPRGKATRYS